MATLLVCGGVAFVAYPIIAKADSLMDSAATNITAYNISKENCEAYQENYLNAEQWATDYAAKIEELQGIVSELDSLGKYVDGDYSVDYNALTYIFEVQVRIDELTNMRDVANQKKKEAEQRAAEERAKRQREREAATSASYSSSRSGSSHSGGGSSYGSSSGSASNFKSQGVIYQNGIRYTYYSSNVLYHYRTPEWTAGSDNTYRDKDGYVVVASSDHAQGSVVSTPFGSGKVYDSGCASGTIDIYTNY